ncbi:hypothetical protein JEM67_18080 [Serratia sp. PAMC26656]|uniref:hypothetical protein n=1 Tax=Serratia sp. PAMC26656 TaxID=2775909 RepID=UPI0018F5073C|nr:hypothetical protein [Serratia sp. PAMC26656]MBJ7891500.1 hypothetical protein [Serratia sp. PAMC26656]
MVPSVRGYLLALIIVSNSTLSFEMSSSGVLSMLGRSYDSDIISRIGFISTTFNDMYSGLEISDKRVEFVTLKSKRKIPTNEIKRHVDKEFKILPELERYKITKQLNDMNKSECDLNNKMNNQNISDDELITLSDKKIKLMRLRAEYLSTISEKYTKITKPKAYEEYMNYVNTSDESYDGIKKLRGAPTEVKSITDDDITSYRRNTDEINNEIREYIQSLH